MMRIFKKLRDRHKHHSEEKNSKHNNHKSSAVEQTTARPSAPPSATHDSAHRQSSNTASANTSNYAKGSSASQSHQKSDANSHEAKQASRQMKQRPVEKIAPKPKPPQEHSHSSRSPQPDSSSGIKFDELYRLKQVLGQGAFSTVREAKHKNDPFKIYAVKCVERAKLSKEDEEALIDEVGILREFNHEHIICLYDFFQDTKMYYLVLEHMSGGELFDRIVAKAYYNEKEARDVCKILLEAVAYCHSNNVAHRDLKPENLLLVSQSDDNKVKIADFGFAKRVLKPNSLSTQCGTPGYVAPEILQALPYDTKADMWSVGVILYILLGGYPPFIENNQRLLFRKIKKGQYEFHEEYWGSVSKEAKNLISSLLCLDPNTRLSAKEALKNKWILSDAATLEGKDLGANLAEFKKFNAKRKFKAAVKSVIAINKLTSLGLNFEHDLIDNDH